jgi:paraquat-inducible protein A
MWPLALLVFFASVVVPMLKLVSLVWFLHAIRRRSARRLRERTVLYRLIDVVGRWSNIDVFMVSILAASLQFGFLTTVDPEAGIVSFAAVVVLTMLATTIFDPRLMWDAARRDIR